MLLELSDEKESYEIINYHIIDNKARTGKENKHKKARMGGCASDIPSPSIISI
ncbi:hypothetical protein [uncultured Brachyspira sp.]|uniref:hypothetical protein n=1 Tax=uncultured Brachyspira sp. TaxID=221953 RepID=UPI0025D5234F|nr:hypothetical protein [uncultured Brachyspira sp.]